MVVRNQKKASQPTNQQRQTLCRCRASSLHGLIVTTARLQRVGAAGFMHRAPHNTRMAACAQALCKFDKHEKLVGARAQEPQTRTSSKCSSSSNRRSSSTSLRRHLSARQTHLLFIMKHDICQTLPARCWLETPRTMSTTLVHKHDQHHLPIPGYPTEV